MNKSYLLAGALLLAVALWISSGMIGGDSRESVISDAEQAADIPAMIVEAELMQAQLITSYVVAQGNLAPNRVVTLRAEAEGQVEALAVTEGSMLDEGAEILRLKVDDREIRRERASLKIDEQRRNLDAVRNLRERGLASQAELDTAQVELKQAEVELAQVELEIENTTVRAPFAGVLDETLVEVGDYLSIGGEVAILVDNDPLVVDVKVPQQNVAYLQLGKPVQVDLVDGRKASGFIRYIAARADEATRTFRIEVEIPNPDGLRAGSSATANIPKEETKAHFVSAALLTLNSAGDMGVKTVDDKGLVSFYPVTIERSETDGMWVSGLPESAMIITSGQGFAEVGGYVLIAGQPSDSEESFQAPSLSNTEKRSHEHFN